MADLYGFKKKYEDGVTDYLVVFGSNIEKSKTARHCLKHFKKRIPQIVSMDWLLDSMIHGVLQDHKNYLIDVSGLKKLIEMEPRKSGLKK
jgi:hypothetical protein